jgi:hypothetical protein
MRRPHTRIAATLLVGACLAASACRGSGVTNASLVRCLHREGVKTLMATRAQVAGFGPSRQVIAWGKRWRPFPVGAPHWEAFAVDSSLGKLDSRGIYVGGGWTTPKEDNLLARCGIPKE